MNYSNHGYTTTYLPRREQTSVSNSYKQKDMDLSNSFKIDALYDLQRWIKSAESEIDNYVTKKVWYDYERQLKGEDETLNLRLMCSDIRGFLVDMRKGIDWYKMKFDTRPKVLINFYDKITQRQQRLNRIKKYLSTRTRRYAAFNAINNTNISLETTKLIQHKIRTELKALDIFLSNHKRYTQRKTMEEIMRGSNGN
jgi:hypothetical protein